MAELDIYTTLNKNLYKIEETRSSIEVKPEQITTGYMSNSTMIVNSSFIMNDDSVGGAGTVGSVKNLTSSIIFRRTDDESKEFLIQKRKSYKNNDSDVLEIFPNTAARASGYNYIFIGKKGDDLSIYNDITVLSTKKKFEIDHSLLLEQFNIPMFFAVVSNDSSAETGVPGYTLANANGLRMILNYAVGDGSEAFNLADASGGGFIGFGYPVVIGGVTYSNIQLWLDAAGIWFGDKLNAYPGTNIAGINTTSSTITSSATPTINTDTTNFFTITALAADITSMTTNLSGTPISGQKLIIRIKDNGSARAIAWGASFVARGVALPTTTVISKYLYVGFIYNTTTSTWDCVAVSQEA